MTTLSKITSIPFSFLYYFLFYYLSPQEFKYQEDKYFMFVYLFTTITRSPRTVPSTQ